MPITFPDFKKTHCVLLTACGDIQAAETKAKKSNREFLAHYRGEGFDIFVAIGGKSGEHFHIDVLESSAKRKLPGTTMDFDKIQAKLDQAQGKKAVVNFRGIFEIDISELPDGGMIKSMFFKTQLGEVAINLKGAKFAIAGAPINEIAWQTTANEKKIRISLECEQFNVTIDENYLTDALIMLEKALNVFVLGKGVK